MFRAAAFCLLPLLVLSYDESKPPSQRDDKALRGTKGRVHDDDDNEAQDLFDGDAFSVHCHAVDAPADGVEVAGEAAPLVNGHLAGIESGDRVVRGRRVSLTIRYLLDFLLDPDAYRPLGPGESWPG